MFAVVVACDNDQKPNDVTSLLPTFLLNTHPAYPDIVRAWFVLVNRITPFGFPSTRQFALNCSWSHADGRLLNSRP